MKQIFTFWEVVHLETLPMALQWNLPAAAFESEADNTNNYKKGLEMEL